MMDKYDDSVSLCLYVYIAVPTIHIFKHAEHMDGGYYTGNKETSTIDIAYTAIGTQSIEFTDSRAFDDMHLLYSSNAKPVY